MFLTGCGLKRVGFEETSCKIDLTLFASDSYKTSSHPNLNGEAGPRNGTLAMSVPPMGYVWVVGTLYNDGVRAHWEQVGHEVMHIMHYQCPRKFADPDAVGKDYLFVATKPLGTRAVPHYLDIKVTGYLESEQPEHQVLQEFDY